MRPVTVEPVDRRLLAADGVRRVAVPLRFAAPVEERAAERLLATVPSLLRSRKRISERPLLFAREGVPAEPRLLAKPSLRRLFVVRLLLPALAVSGAWRLPANDPRVLSARLFAVRLPGRTGVPRRSRRLRFIRPSLLTCRRSRLDTLRVSRRDALLLPVEFGG
jgi:hypothetical protein